MKIAIVTLVPLWIVATLIVGGGMHLARQQDQEFIAVNQQRLFKVDQVLRAELLRLEMIYQVHLEELAERMGDLSDRELNNERLSLPGVVELTILKEDKEPKVLRRSGAPFSQTQVLLKDPDRKLLPRNSIELERTMLTGKLEKQQLWMELPQQGQKLLIQQPKAGTLVAANIDVNQVLEAASKHLRFWLADALQPLEENNEQVVIEMPGDTELLRVASSQGPLAMVIPIHTQMGVWQIRAWDRVRQREVWSLPILTASGALALLFYLSGVILYLQQRRVMRLASQRVSFVNRVSHELSTPLTNLELNVSLVREQMADAPDAIKNRMDLVAAEIQRLSRLVLNVLTFSKAERDVLKLKVEPCVPENVIRRVLDSFRPSLMRRGIEMEQDLEADEPSLLDADALAEVVGNLISNVEKYAAPGRWMRLAAKLDDQMLTIEVVDRGPGIPSNAREKIFAPFERVHSELNEGSSGTGLGLSIARGLAELMGGKLELLESDEGAHFQLILPAPIAAETSQSMKP